MLVNVQVLRLFSFLLLQITDFLISCSFSYPEPFLRAVRRGALAKSITGYHKNMVRKQCPVLELANQMPVRNMDLARAPRRTARKKGSGYENDFVLYYPRSQGLMADKPCGPGTEDGVLQIPAFLIPGFTDFRFSHSMFFILQIFSSRVLQIPDFLIPGFTDSGFLIPGFTASGFSHSGF